MSPARLAIAALLFGSALASRGAADTAPDPVANPAGEFSTAERSYAYLASLRERAGGPRR